MEKINTQQIRAELRKNSKYKLPEVDSEVYAILQNAKRNGNTHASNHFVNIDKIESIDETLCLYDYAGLILKTMEVEINE